MALGGTVNLGVPIRHTTRAGHADDASPAGYARPVRGSIRVLICWWRIPDTGIAASGGARHLLALRGAARICGGGGVGHIEIIVKHDARERVASHLAPIRADTGR